MLRQIALVQLVVLAHIVAHLDFGGIDRRVVDGVSAVVVRLGDAVEVDVEEQLHRLLLDGLDHLVVHLVAFTLVFDQRITLAHATQANAVLEVVHLVQMFAPLAVEHGEHDATLQRTQAIGAELGLEGLILRLGVVDEQLDHGVHGLVALEPFRRLLGLVNGHLGRVQVVHSLEQAVPIPIGWLVGSILRASHIAGERVGDEGLNVLVNVLALQHGLTFRVDHGALLVHHIVVLEHVLTNLEVTRFHGLLRIAHALGHALRLDRLTLGHALRHHTGDELRVEQAHEVVFEAQVEPGLTRIALTSGAAAQLVVDSA